ESILEIERPHVVTELYCLNAANRVQVSDNHTSKNEMTRHWRHGSEDVVQGLWFKGVGEKTWLRGRPFKFKKQWSWLLESSGNKESLGEDASKQERIDAIDADEEITLVSVQNVDDEVVNTAKLLIDDAQVNAAITVTLMEIKSTKPKEKGVVIQELGESTTTISSQQSQGKGREILTEPVKPMKKKDQIRLDEEAALKLQAEFDEEERLAREKAKKEKEANIALIETWDDIQVKIDVDHQLVERLQAQEQEDLFVEEKATLFQQLLEKRRKHFVAKRAEE
ncbi:hypothetical protein Tco_1180302, partial [Tanacetum coccineum]